MMETKIRGVVVGGLRNKCIFPTQRSADTNQNI